MSWKYDRLKWCPTSCWPVSYGPPRMFMLNFRSHLSTNLITPALVNKLQPCFTTCQRNLELRYYPILQSRYIWWWPLLIQLDETSNLMSSWRRTLNICTSAKISAPWPNEASCRISAEGVRRYPACMASVPTTVPLPMLVACAADLYWQLVTTDLDREDSYPSGYNIERWP